MADIDFRSGSVLAGKLSPGFTSKVNLFVDIAIVFILIFAASSNAEPDIHDLRALFWIATAGIGAWVIAAAALRHYSVLAYDRSAFDDVAMISVQVAAVVTLLAIVELFVEGRTATPNIPQLLVLVWCSVALARWFFRRLAQDEPPLDDVLIVGIGPIGRLTASDLRQRGRHRAIGHLRLASENGRETALLHRSYASDAAKCRILGDMSQLEHVLRTVAVDEVYVAGKVRSHGEEMQEAIRICERFGIPFAVPAYAFRLDRAHAVEANAVRDGYLHYETHKPMRQQQAMKRLFDIVASALALWLLLPLFLVVVALIKLTSRGPVFFRQTRVGLHGRTFNMLKFRSMVVNAESLKASLAAFNEQAGPVFKMRHDPRVTPIGRFIRKYSIDELPQLINVLRGDMSVVGPRPPVPDELLKYEAWQRRRLSVRPGLTCIWQVSGRNQISFEDWMLLDMQYIDHWSLVRDFQLIFRTIPVVITGRGAS
jgi:exopolysaccharide biosynthesis polyprenyl glycosylphosphotransferase